eukprot:1160396-Pelagomonas_calceolata.AAC.2
MDTSPANNVWRMLIALSASKLDASVWMRNVFQRAWQSQTPCSISSGLNPTLPPNLHSGPPTAQDSIFLRFMESLSKKNVAKR